MKGILEFSRVNVRTGKKVVLAIVKNTIVDDAYLKLVELFGGEISSFCDRMQFGTGSAATSHDQKFLQTPITPIKSVSSSIDGSSCYTVIFEAYLESDEGNGFPISEAGLLANDGTLIARTTFTATTKTSSYNFGFRWSILVKASS